MSPFLPNPLSCLLQHQVSFFVTVASRGGGFTVLTSCPPVGSCSGRRACCRLGRRRLVLSASAPVCCCLPSLCGCPSVRIKLGRRMFGACCHLLAQGTRHSDFCTSEDLDIIVGAKSARKGINYHCASATLGVYSPSVVAERVIDPLPAPDYGEYAAANPYHN